MDAYQIGSTVKVKMPSGLLEGKIVAGPSIKWSFDGEIKYEVLGTNKQNPFVTICSARSFAP